MHNTHGGQLDGLQIKYDFSVNVNPLGTPPQVQEAMRQSLLEVEHYPEYGAVSLAERLGEVLGIAADNIVITAGASEAFMAICHARNFKRGYVQTPSFYGYEYALSAIGAEVIFNGPRADCEGAAVFVANPNNPDGRLADAESLNATGGTLIVDECFLPLTDHLDMTMVGQDGDMYVVRSFTKTFAMPGVRLGYVVCQDEQRAEELRMQLPEWNVSGIALAAGHAALKSMDRLSEARRLIRIERDYLVSTLAGLGLRPHHSEANYILFEGPLGLKEQLVTEGILIRDCSNYRGLMPDYYRIAVRRHEENLALERALEAIL